MGFNNWLKTNIHKHRAPGYAIATITLKTIGQIPGDAAVDNLLLAALSDNTVCEGSEWNSGGEAGRAAVTGEADGLARPIG